MIKQVLILAASVCGIAIVVASMSGQSASEAVSEKPAETVEKKAPVVVNTAQEDADYYSEDDSDQFVFGEPVEYSDGDDAEQYDEPSEIIRPSKTDRSYAASSTTNPKSKPKFSKSPAPGEPGSKENPVDLSPAKPRT